MSEEHLSYEEKKAQREAEKDTHRHEQRSAHKRAKSKAWVLWIVGILIVVGGIWWAVSATGGGEGPVTVVNPHSIDSRDHIKGNSGAAVTLVEYSDFQCPACRAYHPILKQLHESFPDDLRIVYRHFPLTSIHQNAEDAAQAAEAAGVQGKFWEYHDRLFLDQPEWSSLRRLKSTFLDYAEGLELDLEQFEADLDNDDLHRKVKRDRAAGAKLQLNGTPSFFLNERKIQNPRSIEDFEALIQSEIDKL
jgi:protein-disulfide isomerase